MSLARTDTWNCERIRTSTLTLAIESAIASSILSPMNSDYVSLSILICLLLDLAASSILGMLVGCSFQLTSIHLDQIIKSLLLSLLNMIPLRLSP